MYQSNTQAFDKSQLEKLDARSRASDNRTPPPRPFSKSSLSSSLKDISPTSRTRNEHRNSRQLKPLSLPILPGRPGLVESPLSRWADTVALSPRNLYARFGANSLADRRALSEVADYSEQISLPGIRPSGSATSEKDDSSSITSRSRDSCDHRVSPEYDGGSPMEENGFRRLRIDDHRPEAHSLSVLTGQKRRASSPPEKDEPSLLHTVGSATDLYRRRESASRASPSSRFHSTSGSVSSTASAPRNNSYASSLSITASSITSMGSHGHLSPGGVSPGGLSTTGSEFSDSACAPLSSLNPSPRGSISRKGHNQGLSDSRSSLSCKKLSEGLENAEQQSPPRLHGLFMCDCCPKKPRRFDTQDELRSCPSSGTRRSSHANRHVSAHEQEKQYECLYCRNRFKNKNEAERHQNSLHLRRHSWSCAALSGYAAAFHTSPNEPNEADTCGYCGEDFPRSGISSSCGSSPPLAIATDNDWHLRIQHLQEVHKFGECNHAKKFFRADHFRQHLKHSHAGTSGKWTNILESSCMKDEPLPEPIRGPDKAHAGLRVGRITEEDEIL